MPDYCVLLVEYVSYQELWFNFLNNKFLNEVTIQFSTNVLIMRIQDFIGVCDIIGIQTTFPHFSYQIEEKKVGGMCSTHGDNDKFVQYCDRKSLW
jgi:hypothetical protein